MADASKKQVAVAGNVENPAQKPKFPRSVLFIIGNEFCERFCYYGMRTILVLYLSRKLLLEEDHATLVFHIFTLLLYFFCIFGAIIADSFIGKFKTILSLSVVYAIGSCIVTAGAIEPWKVPAKEMTFIGLTLIAIGSGGIKPCVAAFGAEQFQLPEQAKFITKFFALFYFTINLGSFISTLVTPLLREDIQCFGMSDCFPAGFGLPAALMILAITIFALGRFLYKIAPYRRNMVVKVLSCIGNAISTRRRQKGVNKAMPHWLDYAEEKHGKKLVQETKVLLHLLVLFIPLPLFWALFDQQGSRWTFQATKMNGDIGGGFIVKPDQMQVFNPLLILIFIPLFEYAFYPLLKCLGIRRPLQKMALGGIFAGLAFIASMLVQIEMDDVKPAKISILYQLPQYVLMTLGEVMFSVTGLEFSFTQAPESMKSVVQAFWLLTVAGGNLIVAVIVSISMMPHQAFEFGLFAILMFVDMIFFMILAFRYKPMPISEIELN